MVEVQVDAKLARSLVQHTQPLGHDLFANAVPGNDCNAMLRHSDAPENIAACAYFTSALDIKDLKII